MRGNNLGAIIAGLVLILLGTGFLLENAGLIDFDWSVLWPIALIVAGAVVLIGPARFGAATQAGVRTLTIPRERTARLELKLRLGAGRYRLAGSPATDLVEVTAEEETVSHDVKRRGDITTVRLSTRVEGWGRGWRSGQDWQIGVAPAMPTLLDVEAGAGEFILDLSGIAVTEAKLGVGAAELTVVLPHPVGDVPIRLEGAAARFTFQVPAGVEARITATGLLSTTGPTESPGYAAARDRVTVQVTGGAAQVRIQPLA